MFSRNFSLTAIFIVLAILILPVQTAFANEESEKHNSLDQDSESADEIQYELDRSFYELEKSLSLATREDPKKYCTKAGKEYYNSEKYILALLAFNDAIELDDNDAGLYDLRGQTYQKLKNFDKAKKDFLTAGKKYINSKEYSRAAEVLQKATNLDLNYGEAYYYWAKAEDYQSHNEAAIKKYEESIRLGYTKDDNVYYILGYKKYILNEYENAIKYFDEYIKKSPAFANAYRGRGECYYALEKYDKALEDFEKYLKYAGGTISDITKRNYEAKIDYCKEHKDLTNPPSPPNLWILEILNEINMPLKILFGVMALEYLLAICCEQRAGNLTLGSAVLNLLVKIILLVFVLVANALENLDIEALNSLPIRNLVIAMLLACELSALIEKADLLGAPVPDWLKSIAQTINQSVRGVFERIFGGRRQN